MPPVWKVIIEKSTLNEGAYCWHAEAEFEEGVSARFSSYLSYTRRLTSKKKAEQHFLKFAADNHIRSYEFIEEELF